MAIIRRRTIPLGFISRPQSSAERMGFEPMKHFWRLHTFQACLFNHSSISPNDFPLIAPVLFIFDYQILERNSRVLGHFPTRISTANLIFSPQLGATIRKELSTSKSQRAQIPPHRRKQKRLPYNPYSTAGIYPPCAPPSSLANLGKTAMSGLIVFLLARK